MAKRTATRSIPFTAIPETLFGEAACKFADAHGFDVATHALRGERALSTADARTFLAKGKADGLDYSSAIWIITAYRLAA